MSMNEFGSSKLEFGSAAEDIAAFNETIEAINRHNDQFSLGKAMAKALLGHINQQDRVRELEDAGATQEEAQMTVDFVGDDGPSLSEEEQMARAAVGITNASTLEATGLGLSPLRTTNTMIGPEGEQPIGEVRIQVVNGGKFSDFLSTVDPDKADETFKKNALDTVNSIATEVTTALLDDTDEQVALETLSYGKGILDGLERLGLSDSRQAVRFSVLYEHSRQGDVREYVKADMIGLLEEPESQEFGPANWHADMTSEDLEKNWNKVLDVIKMADSNPAAKELHEQLVSTAVASLDYAKADWATLQADGYGGKDYGNGFDKVYETIGLELAMITSPNNKAE